jgi:uncharacterized protein (DUF427 family)
VEIVNTNNAVRVLETASPATYYVDNNELNKSVETRRETDQTHCPWKGDASYWTITVNGKTSKNAAWSYEDPKDAFKSIKGWLAFYPSRVDGCYVGDEKVGTQTGGFYVRKP